MSEKVYSTRADALNILHQKIQVITLLYIYASSFIEDKECEFNKQVQKSITLSVVMDFIFPENFISLRHENHGLLALAQLILPSEILSNFEVVRVEEEASLIRIYLDESVKADYKENPLIESKGFCDAVTIRNFQGFREKILEKDEEKEKKGDSRN